MEPGRPSATAQRVAAQRLTFQRLAAPFGDPSADDRLARDVAGEIDGPPVGILTRYLRHRTAFVDRAVVRAIEAGTTQLVVVGAGYDGRALRYARADVTWFEVDHPDTQEDKRRRLDALGITRTGIVFVPTDFTTGGPSAALAGAGHHPDRPSLLVCEGVAVYLDPGDLAALLDDLRTVAAPASRLVLTLSADGSDPGTLLRRQAFEAGVAALGEPARNRMTAQDAAPLLEAAGWRPAAGADQAWRSGFVVAAPV
jgi:methyltransferase (TIGR00027 family)